MLFGEMLAVALQSIRANLFRGFLTMLGIIIGVASVITMVALGSGAQRAIDEQIGPWAIHEEPYKESAFIGPSGKLRRRIVEESYAFLFQPGADRTSRNLERVLQ